MKLPLFLSIVFIIGLAESKAQNISIDNQKEELNSSMMEFLTYKQQQLVDELDSIKEKVDPKVEVSADDLVILKRLKSTSKSIQLDYNSRVKGYIDKYASQNYRPYMNKLYSLSHHYFSVYDPIFREMNVPEEIKFLSLVESSLDPHLVSRSGAVGPWQFMHITAKQYDLDMNKNVDERKDIYASSYAVTKYLREAYDQFNDWYLAIASYNCGRGCVQRAIKRSGMNNPTYWELSPFLPEETRNYIPKFIAMTYVMSNADYYGIEAISTELDFMHKAVMVDKNVRMSSIASALGISTEGLKKYNPAIKQEIVAASIDHPQRILLPQTTAINDTLLYQALNTVEVLPKRYVEEVVEREDQLLDNNVPSTYKVRRGETLNVLSKRFGVSVQNLRAWNNLTSRSPIVGRILTLEKPINERLAKNVKKATSSRNNTTYYTVRKGDSLDRIANKFDGASVSKLKADNNLRGSMIKPGMRLKINKG